MPAGQLIVFDKAKLNFLNATNLLNPANAFSGTLHAGTYAPAVGTNEVYADATGELATGFGYTAGGLALAGVALTLIPAQTISSITFAGAVATLTTGAAHGLSTGHVVTVAGTTSALYSGTFTITVTTATAFTYTMTGTPAANATVVGSYGGVIKFTCSNLVWTASGGSIPAWRTMVVRASGTLNAKVGPLVGYLLGDSTNIDVPATTTGNTLTVSPSASGLISAT